MQLPFTTQYQRIKAWYKKYERWLMPVTLVSGFLFDYITFTSIQISTTFMLLLGYWIVAGFAIALSCWQNPKPLLNPLRYIKLFSPLIIQFCFGSLLGSSLLFYWFSGAFSVSWPIILALALLIITNEVFKDYFLHPVVQIGVFFFSTFSLLSTFYPYTFNSLNFWFFILAGATSVLIFYFYIRLLLWLEASFEQKRRSLWIVIAIIYIAFNALYFLNIIPPIPLSLKEAGLYHSLKVVGGKYHLQGEVENFWQRISPGQNLHLMPGEKVYCYSAIFAPNNLTTTIVHHWQYYDPVQKKWIERGAFPFTISGGAKNGYKGYSWNSNLPAGTWRIDVENLRGQVLGRIHFTVQEIAQKSPLQEVIR